MANYNQRNTRNPQSELFKALTRLFSGPIVNYRSQSGRRIRRQHLDKYSNIFKSASGQQFKKASYNPFEEFAAAAMANQRRSERYVDFDQMEYTPEIASALDIYADEMTTHSDLQEMLKIKCVNEEIRAVLSTLYANILNVNSNLFGWCRTMCKYGDFFLYMDIDEKLGIQTVIPLPTQEVERLEGEDKTNPNYIQYQWNSAAMTFENWQIAHFRILGNDKHAPYGTSVLEAARRIWRQLVLLEDAMMAYRIVRAPSRRVFYVDVGQIAPQDVEQYMQKVMTQMKRHQVMDPDSGRVDLRYNPMSIEEDYYIPQRGGTGGTKIENLAGATFDGGIDDVKYLRDKLFSALKIPASYLSRAEGADEDKATLAQKDIRFARTIQRLQRVIISELEKIGIVHLYTLGFRGDDLLAFTLSLNNPSKIAELQELEHWKQKFDIAAAATEGFFSRRWVAHKIFGLSDEEVVRNQREMFHDRKLDAALGAVAEAAAAEAAGGGMGDMGDLGGEGEDLGDLGGPEEMAPEDAAETAEAPEDDSALLAAPPGHRESPRPGESSTPTEKSVSPKAKGHAYYHKYRDKRTDGTGQRLGSHLSAATPKVGTTTSTFPGLKDLRSTWNGMLEDKQPIYNEQELGEENRLHEINFEIRSLINSLNFSKEDESHENEA
jgi:hypothetical protein